MRQIYGYLTIVFCYCVSAQSSEEGVNTTDCSGNIYNSVYQFGAAFLSNNGGSIARGPLTMILPADSDYMRKQRTRRHVICGKSQLKRKPRENLSYEQRAICQYKHVLNIDQNRVPTTLEEVKCECDRPSHLSTYSEIRCEPVKYRFSVLRLDPSSEEFYPDYEELTLACIPVVPRSCDYHYPFHHPPLQCITSHVSSTLARSRPSVWRIYKWGRHMAFWSCTKCKR